MGPDGISHPDVSGHSLIKHLIAEMGKNIHFSNLVKLLSDFHGYSETISLTSQPSVYLLWCVGSGDDDINQYPVRNTKCTKAVLSLRRGANSKCRVCEYRHRNCNRKESQKQMSGHKRIMPESKCPITHLSPDSRKKRLSHCRVRKFRLNAMLTRAMEKK